MEILQQLGQLVLGSVPTMVLFVLLVVAYRALVYKPLHRVLDERRRRTVGAMDEARLAISAAEHKADEYESRLRLVRMELAQLREQRLAAWATEREQVLAAAQERAQLRVKTARLEMDQAARDARTAIEQSAEMLGRQVLAAVLPQGAAQ